VAPRKYRIRGRGALSAEEPVTVGDQPGSKVTLEDGVPAGRMKIQCADSYLRYTTIKHNP
jgi:hypothetical protein